MVAMVLVAVPITVGDGVRRAWSDPCGVDLRELRARAIEHAGLADQPALRRRARLAGLLPQVSVRAARGWAWDDPWTGVRAADDGVARRDTLDVRLTWRLDRIVFDASESTALSGERSAARARRELEDDVTTRYFRWRRAYLEAAATDGEPERLAAEEAFASLDALTGGWFGERVGCER
jgi:outer membrane protein TolC